MLHYFSNEIVFRGHPDKVCDQISAAILAECMKQDPNTRAGIEVAGGKGKIFLTGELTTNANINVISIVKRVLADVGYKTDYEIIDNIGKQSSDIAQGVDIGGAGDQGMMFGFACKDTPEKLPKAMVILQKLSKAYDLYRRHDSRFLPDGKAQITGVYDDRMLVRIKDFTISYQNTEQHRSETDEIVKRMATIACNEVCGEIEVENWHINPTGRFFIGGFEGDAGLTGRKIVVDAYQSFANVGGGCMNGKDPTKVDFSAAHMAREFAKEMLTKKELEWCEVQLSYAIGMKEPLAIYVSSNRGDYSVAREQYGRFTPENIINSLNLRNADFEGLARFGHFTS